MFKSLLYNKKPYIWTLFHIVIGIISTETSFPFILWFYLLLFFTLFNINGYHSNLFAVKYIILTCYLVSLETLGRLSKASPFVPYESGKYLLILLSTLGLGFSKKKFSTIGVLLFLLILPAFFYDFSNKVVLSDFIFNGFAPLGLALGISFWGNIKIDIESLNTVLRLIWLVLLSSLIFVIIKTPDYDEISFGYGANFETTGGESSNQVSSLLGVGMFLSFYSWLSRLKFSGSSIFDLLIMLGFAFQGLLTFSRGGILVGLVAIIIYYLTSDQKTKNTNSVGTSQLKSFLYTTLVAVLCYFIFQKVDSITGGKLIHRYSGETQGTLLGKKEKSIDVITSNRWSILQGDFELWSNHPFLGVGVGASKFLREGRFFISHVEFSRLVAEHGLLGFMYFCMLIYTGLNIYRNIGNKQHRSLMLSIFFIGLATSFHSATRTFITPLFIALSTLQPLLTKLQRA
jgi:hypothetical protein